MKKIKECSIDELDTVASEIRKKILDTVSKNGGHLSSTMGATDLIVAMHKVFDVEKDPFIFDVSHQAYAHKLLTGRWDSFDTLRQFNGMCGYTKPSESKYDYYVAGHSSTSISLAVGAAKAIALKGEDRIPVAFIGDGSMSAGMVYEALNELGDRKYPVVIILNDNEMSIAKPIGAISKLLSQTMAGSFYQRFKGKVEQVLEHLPEGASYMAKRFEESFKLITPGILFEEMGIEYIGPVDGHNIETLIETMEVAKALGKPVIIHAQTTKGKGYKIAEGTKEHWHGVSAFDLETGASPKKNGPKAATAIFSETLVQMADEDEKIVGVTAAMPSGTGLSAAIEKYPERFWDVAIAEQHAVTLAAGFACEGLKPVVAIYSSFLQRAYDQLIHDVALQNLPVLFAIDRAGIVGADGETHQGAYDLSFMRCIPNMVIMAPSDTNECRQMLYTGYQCNQPVAVRYPRGSAGTCEVESTMSAIEIGKARSIKQGSKVAILSFGTLLENAKVAAEALNATVIDMRFIKPLDTDAISELLNNHDVIVTLEDNAIAGGAGSAVNEYLAAIKANVTILNLGIPDEFIKHGTQDEMHAEMGLDANGILTRIKEFMA